MKYILLLLSLLGLPLLSSCGESETSTTESKEVFVSAAASLSEAMVEIRSAFEADYPDASVTLNFGGSGKLAQQIQQGAPVDVFLSADQKWMDVLEDEKLLIENTRIDFTKNKLVLIGKKDVGLEINSFTTINPNKIGQIAIGNPESVPAGSYAKEALVHLEKWDELSERFVYAKDVRQVLTYVESGNTDIGFVYQTDVLRSENVEVLAEADNNLHTPIVYPAAVTASSDNATFATRFVEFLQNESSQAILANYGFAK